MSPEQAFTLADENSLRIFQEPSTLRVTVQDRAQAHGSVPNCKGRMESTARNLLLERRILPAAYAGTS